MKKIFTLFALIPLASAVSGQISISSTDIPSPGTFNCVDFSSTVVPNPAMSADASWDYGADTSTNTFTNVYTPETNTFFTSAGIGFYVSSFKSLTPALGYYVYSELDFNTTDVKESGLNIPAQGYDLSAFTGSTADSIVIPAQQYLLTTPKEIMHFPFTAGSAWGAVSRRTTNFSLSVAAAGLSHTPGEQAYYVHRTDTIKGWGTLRVHTTSGPSMLYNVLVDKIAEYSIDSFYLGGAPAPTALLTGFGMTQGQTTDTNYRYNFYRKGSYNYLLSFYYRGDVTYTNPRNKYQNTDNLLATNEGVNGPDNTNYTTVLFPNPASGNSINVLFHGKDIHPKTFTITDVTGRTVQYGEAVAQQDNLHIDLDNKMANGNYIINVWDNENNKVVTEQFVVAR